MHLVDYSSAIAVTASGIVDSGVAGDMTKAGLLAAAEEHSTLGERWTAPMLSASVGVVLQNAVHFVVDDRRARLVLELEVVGSQLVDVKQERQIVVMQLELESSEVYGRMRGADCRLGLSGTSWQNRAL